VGSFCIDLVKVWDCRADSVYSGVLVWEFFDKVFEKREVFCFGMVKVWI
jgi:hypothetical protein